MTDAPVSAPTPSMVTMTTDPPGLTEYLILKRKGEAGNVWGVVNHASAKTAEAAVRQVVEKLAEADRSGTFVAVPARNWRPVTVSPKVTTSLVIEEAK